MGGASALQLRPFLLCLPLTDIHRMLASPYTAEFGCGGEQCVVHTAAKSAILDGLVSRIQNTYLTTTQA